MVTTWHSFLLRAAGLSALAVSASAVSASLAWADAQRSVLPQFAKPVFNTLEPGSVLIEYCPGCNGRFRIDYVLERRLVPGNRCELSLEVTRVPLFRGRAQRPRAFALTSTRCLADGEAGKPTARALPFNYSYRPSAEPGTFIWTGRGTMVEPVPEQKRLQLSLAEQKALAACRSQAAKHHQSEAPDTQRQPTRTERPEHRVGAPAPATRRTGKYLRTLQHEPAKQQQRQCLLNARAAAFASEQLQPGTPLAHPGWRWSEVEQVELQKVKSPRGTRHRLLINGDAPNLMATYIRIGARRFINLGWWLGCPGALSRDAACFDLPKPAKPSLDALSLSSHCANVGPDHQASLVADDYAFLLAATEMAGCVDRDEMMPHPCGPDMPAAKPPWQTSRQLWVLVPPPPDDVGATEYAVRTTLTYTHHQGPGCFNPYNGAFGKPLPCEQKEHTTTATTHLRGPRGPEQLWAVPVAGMQTLDFDHTESVKVQAAFLAEGQTLRQTSFFRRWPMCR